MQTFNELRKASRDKRDRTIAQARADHAAALAKIADLEISLLDRPPAKLKSAAACIDSILPQDGPFTALDIVARLEAMDLGRAWSRRSIDSHLTVLRRRGAIRRLRRSNNHEPALYVAAGVEVDCGPFEDMTLADAAAVVLATRPMNATELVVALLEAGYHTTRTRTGLRHALGEGLRRDERFKLRGGKWGLVPNMAG